MPDEPKRGLIVCGETLIDLVPQGNSLLPVPGGGPFTTAIAAAKLGAPTALLSLVSSDQLGRGCVARITEAGVDTRLLVQYDVPTTLAMPDIDSDGVATYQFYWEGTTNDQTYIELPHPPTGLAPAAIHVASLATVLWPARGAILEWIRASYPGVPITFDINARPTLLPDRDEYLRRVQPWLAVCSLARASSEDVEFLYPGTAFDDIVADWFVRYPTIDVALITCGGDGSLAYLRGAPEPQRTPPVPVTIADTVGAGDTFTGAFLDGHYRLGLPVGEAVSRASVAAAITCSRVGARPPTADELAAALRG